MTRQDRQEGDGRTGQSNRAEPVEWRDIFEGRAPGSEGGTDESHELEAETEERTRALDALTRTSALFTGLSGSLDDSIRTYVTELPQWFRCSGQVEAEIRVEADVFETENFQWTTDPLMAAARTRAGTRVSMTVVCTGGPPDDGRETWLGTERKLVEALVSIVKDGIGRWEIDSLKRVSDGVAVLDGDLTYTYVNQQAEQLLGRDSDDLYGECVWDVFPEAADTVAEEKIRTAVETQSPRSFERYRSRQEQWVEARVHPSENHVIVVFRDISDAKAAERRIERVLETVPVGIVLLTVGGKITRANSRAEELLGLSRDTMDGVEYDHSDWNIWDDAGDPVPRADHPVTHVRATGETVQGFTHGITLPDGTERWLSSNAAPVEREDGGVEQIVVALEDITVLKRLEQLIETLQPIDEVLNSAASRQETADAICELLTDTRQYQYARFSEHTPGTALTESHVEGQPECASSGEGVDRPGESPTEVEPIRVAIETGEIQAVTGAGSDSRFESWREATLGRGFRGGAVVPFGHQNRIYGLFVLYTDRSGAFERREQTLLRTLGDRIGQVFHKLETERVLHADKVAELTLESTDPGSFFVAASEELDCTIDVVDTIPASDEALVHYLSLRDAPLGALGEFIEDRNYEARMREIRHADESPGGTAEVRLHRESLEQTLVALGAVVTADRITDGRAEVVCEVPSESDISSLVTRVRDSFPGTRVVAKREYNRATKSTTRSADQMLERVFREELTDRQRQVLQAAMYSGYFESPRQSTATEIADALSLTQSTFSYHLRNAQQTLFERLFDRLGR
jgi:PAS domain S-box-containing protein